MIKYILKCKNKHEFESWFSNSAEFEKLKKKQLLECIFCKSKKIEKSIMSPRVLNSSENSPTIEEISQIKKDLKKVRDFVEKNFKYVGNNFSQEVRNLYYDKKGDANIYGTATPEEKEELKEEGIELTSVPWICLLYTSPSPRD